MTGGWTLPEKIARLKRGCESIVFNPERVHPIYLQKGGEQVLSTLEALRGMGVFSEPPVDIIEPGLFKFLLEHHLIVPQHSDRKRSNGPCPNCEGMNIADQRSLYLLLSQHCNQACIYCYNGEETYQVNDRRMMSFHTARRAVDRTIESISDGGKLELIFFGGEPLLNWPLAKKIIHYCEKGVKTDHPEKSIHYHLTTNLTLFPDDLIDYALKFGITFLVDVDGPEEIHNKTRPFRNGSASFRTTATNIEKLLEAGIRVGLRATLTTFNQHRMLEISETHKAIGGESCAMVPLNAVDSDGLVLPFDLCPDPKIVAQGLKDVYRKGGWPIEQLHPFNDYVHRLKPGFHTPWGCGAPSGNTPVVAINGKIFSCIYLVNNPAYEIGDIHGHDFPRREVLQRMMAIIDMDNRSLCKKCDFRYLCGGGCPVGLFSVAGNPNASKRIKHYTQEIACAVAKTVLNELFWDLGDTIAKQELV